MKRNWSLCGSNSPLLTDWRKRGGKRPSHQGKKLAGYVARLRTQRMPRSEPMCEQKFGKTVLMNFAMP